MPSIAKFKYLPNREARAFADNIVNPTFIRIDDFVEKEDGTWKRTKVGCFVRKRETAEAFAELLLVVSKKLRSGVDKGVEVIED